MSTYKDILRQIEGGLKKYYAAFNQEYAGEFAIFCEENILVLDEDPAEVLREDLNQDDCMDMFIVAFDDNFPFPKDIDSDQRDEFVRSALKACNNGTIDRFISEHGPVCLPNSLVKQYLSSLHS